MKIGEAIYKNSNNSSETNTNTENQDANQEGDKKQWSHSISHSFLSQIFDGFDIQKFH